MTGPEMLLNTLIKLFKLEPEVEKLRGTIKEAVEQDILGQVKQALETVGAFDVRLERIERALGIETSSGSIVLYRHSELNRDNSVQLSTGTDN